MNSNGRRDAQGHEPSRRQPAATFSTAPLGAAAVRPARIKTSRARLKATKYCLYRSSNARSTELARGRRQWGERSEVVLHDLWRTATIRKSLEPLGVMIGFER